MPPPHRARPVVKQKHSWWKKMTSFLRKNAQTPSQLINLAADLTRDPSRPLVVMAMLIVVEIVVNVVIVAKVPYTEIDWKAYMQEVEGFWNGTWDYELLRGDTGPLVYPAGFVYVFLGLYHVTSCGVDVRFAQWIFASFYVVFIFLVFRLYHKSKTVPPYAFVFMCCTSYRIHSLFALRLFNDPVAMFFFFLCLNFILDEWFIVGCALYSFAVSIKMNVLLFAPGLGVVLLSKKGWRSAFALLAICVVVQTLLGAPFLLANPRAYLFRSFELSRQFLYQWTVNWRCIPESLFLDRNFQTALLAGHLVVLIVFAHFRWTASSRLPRGGGLIEFLKDPTKINFDLNQVIAVLFTSNFIGMTFSRSLHYQFYVWYYHTLYFLLWRGTLVSNGLRLLILGFIELSWNTYPSTVHSSYILHACHLLLLVLLFKRDEPKARASTSQKVENEMETDARKKIE